VLDDTYDTPTSRLDWLGSKELADDGWVRLNRAILNLVVGSQAGAFKDLH
jgi:hypothetical protein